MSTKKERDRTEAADRAEAESSSQQEKEFEAPVKVHVSSTGNLIFQLDDPKAIKRLSSGRLYSCSMTFNDTSDIGGDGGDKPPTPKP